MALLLSLAVSLPGAPPTSCARERTDAGVFNFWRNMLLRALMATGPITVVEVEPFPARAAVIWSDEERSAFVDFIARHPEADSVIPGTEGVRKVRWSRAGSGKRGGARSSTTFIIVTGQSTC